MNWNSEYEIGILKQDLGGTLVKLRYNQPFAHEMPSVNNSIGKYVLSEVGTMYKLLVGT